VLNATDHFPNKLLNFYDLHSAGPRVLSTDTSGRASSDSRPGSFSRSRCVRFSPDR